MTNEIKEIYLSNLEWTKTHDNDIKVNDDMGGVIGNIVFKENMSYEEFQKLFKSGYFILCDKDYITNLQDKLKWYENIDPNKTIDKFRLEHNMKVKNLHQRIDRALDLLNEPQFELNNIPCNYENDIEKLRNILRGDE